jgi:hypothetical protein
VIAQLKSAISRAGKLTRKLPKNEEARILSLCKVSKVSDVTHVSAVPHPPAPGG